MANQEVTTHKQRKFFKQNNRRYTDIYQGCKKGVIRTKKRFLHQKCERKEKKTAMYRKALPKQRSDKRM